ncbi:LacI family DNA-binding transcriptional regulator [Marinoscillum furvescens]|uniref:LacI family transcriptional regulator n=1 Tax=Marinoscillum furvescens DSM 4134 TaxID=1122208 RepID=A0A3D9LGX8_MARFU|nr:LacI family DNA-binding transcriptional regulator [Marinoscillum furvescens]REE05868.1 LacI family transcriptional regulator [Marinoscillum furvescens DSM 4134]
MSSRITLKDLAKKLNLSPSTISRALADHHSIGEETKKRVREKAEEVGFTPNSIAASFRKKKTKSIGIIVPRIDVHFHSRVISGIEEFAYKTGYNVTIFQSKDSFVREKEITKILQNRMVEGIIVCLSIETQDYEHFKRFKKLGMPLVFYDRVPSSLDANKIIVNDFESAFTATEHLIKNNCKRIAHIAGSQNTDIFKERLKGYTAALKKHHLKIDPDLILPTNNLSYEEGVICANKYLEMESRPDGVFCANDYTAVSVIQVFRKAGINIPKDVAIVGFSNYPISGIIEPNLTTVNDRAFQMGEAAARLLTRQIEDEENYIGSEIITLNTELIVRESSIRKASNK